MLIDLSDNEAVVANAPCEPATVPKKTLARRNNSKRKRSLPRTNGRDRQGTLRARPLTTPIRDATTESDEDIPSSSPRVAPNSASKKQKSGVPTGDERSLTGLEEILKGLEHAPGDTLEGRLRDSDPAAYQRLRMHQALMYFVSGVAPQ